MIEIAFGPAAGRKRRSCPWIPTTFTLYRYPRTGAMGMALNMDEEVRLYTTNAEREKFETRATLYGIIVGLDYLERAYVRDAVTAAE